MSGQLKSGDREKLEAIKAAPEFQEMIDREMAILALDEPEREEYPMVRKELGLQ